MTCLNPLACQDGFYGDNCDNSCACRVVTECTDKINGGCTCQAGFTGTTCEQTCPTGLYGLGCASECECSLMGTRVCDHITGLCDCLDSWRGFLCEIEGKSVSRCWHYRNRNVSHYLHITPQSLPLHRPRQIQCVASRYGGLLWVWLL